ncbi:hypothetical protein [Nonomuraea fuscirosea]
MAGVPRRAARPPMTPPTSTCRTGSTRERLFVRQLAQPRRV